MSQRMGRGLVGAITAVLFLGVIRAEDAPSSAVKYRLAYRFAPEQVEAFTVEQTSEITNHLNDVKEVIANKAEFRRHFRVLSVEKDGAADLEMTIDWVRMAVTYNDDPTKTVIFKSDDPAFHHPKMKGILASVGKPQAIVKIGPTGKTLKVTPTADAAPAVPVGEAANGVASTSPEGYLSPLPEGPVAIGDFWKERFSLNVDEGGLPKKIELLRSYKLTAVENGQARIEFHTTILTPVDAPEVEMQLTQRQTSGRILFDLTRGQVISRETQVDRTVIGPFQGKGSNRANSTYKEQRVVEEIAAKEGSSAAK